jgi:fatty acid synthase subunit alpha
LASATQKLCVEDLGSKEAWTAKEFGIPLYNTEDGKRCLFHCVGLVSPLLFVSGLDTRQFLISTTHFLCDQIFTLPIQWFRSDQLPETTAHAVDFGPGGLSGVGPLTSRNLDGRGVPVSKARGNTKL